MKGHDDPILQPHSCLSFFHFLKTHHSNHSLKPDLKAHLILFSRLFKARKFATIKTILNSVVTDSQFRSPVSGIVDLLDEFEFHFVDKLCDMLFRVCSDNRLFPEAVRVFDYVEEKGFLLQKPFSSSNRLPEESVKASFCESDETVRVAYADLITSSKETLDSILELQEALIAKNPSVTQAVNGSEKSSKEVSNVLEDNLDQEWSQISRMHNSIASFRDKSINKWQRITQVTTGVAAIKGKHAFNQDISNQVAGYMRDPSRMVKQMQLRKSAVNVFGSDIRNGSGNHRALSSTTLFPQSIRNSTPKSQYNRGSSAPPTSIEANGNILNKNNGSHFDVVNGINRNMIKGREIDERQYSAKLSEIDVYESSRYDALLLKEDLKNTNWLHSVDDKFDQGSLLFDNGFENLPEPFGLL
ncbi:unnamed protein product [Vicia faba]|uniref:AATF leucine zipper-containing domain-containing protein n=1 Tax=Vicia faba TaxID=3906 RepID=A0AAV0YVL0_VICFA|nr:unnamed protein product [Vicia faba]